ncbi:hypothetical protein TNCV_2739941 [Trichonephila clavipes]|nr:hypothetical protein TNCV_2739941 [Trichonephila clavipes]
MVHDGIPAHLCAHVRDLLTMVYSGHRLSGFGLFLWPPRSPDLTSLDFFQRGNLMDLVCRSEVTLQTETGARLHAASTSVDTLLRLEIWVSCPEVDSNWWGLKLSMKSLLLWLKEPPVPSILQRVVDQCHTSWRFRGR